MAGKSSSAAERTEKATPRRLEEARKKGQIAKSMDFNAAMNFAGLFLVLYLIQDQFYQTISTYFVNFFGHQLLTDTDDLFPALFQGVSLYFKLIFPIFLAALVIALVSNLFQVGFMFTLEPLKPSWERLNFINGLQKIFSARTLVELAKNILKISIMGFVVFTIVKHKILSLFALSNMDISAIAFQGKTILFSIALAVVLAYLVIAIFDLIYQRYEFNKNMRMTKQEVKDEYKQTEGSPEIKAKQREMQRRLATRRMMEEVPKATVVITNPTHFAVAIRYERKEMTAPMVVAKGADLLAERIKELAKDHQVPIVENKPVAQFLYWKVEIGDSIPNELYQAVAEILAVILQKQKRRF
ncbi:MAG: flagellar biosynthesis protein FlhB [Dehalobacterium sp.]